MKPEDQQRAIAEACGWVHEPGEEPPIDGTYTACGWTSPSGNFHPSDWTHKSSFGTPDYLHDLNAMRDARKTLLTDKEQIAFVQELWKLVGSSSYRDSLTHSYWPMVDATAAQQSEAFLRAKGLWKEETK